MDGNAGKSSDLGELTTFTQSDKQSGQESNPRCHQETKNPGRAPPAAAAGHRDRAADFTQFLWQNCSHTPWGEKKKGRRKEGVGKFKRTSLRSEGSSGEHQSHVWIPLLS